MTSFFVQTGRRADGRIFTVERWVADGIAIVVHADGAVEAAVLGEAERQSIGLVPLELPAGSAFSGELLERA